MEEKKITFESTYQTSTFEELEKKLADAIKDYESIKKRYNIALDKLNELDSLNRKLADQLAVREKTIARMHAEMDGAEVIRTDRKIRSIEIYFEN